MESITVSNLSTGESRVYQVHPDRVPHHAAEDAVILADRQSKNDLDWWAYDWAELRKQCRHGDYTVSIGDWCAFRWFDGKKPKHSKKV